MAIHVGVFQTHPIQYFAPLWRLLAKQPGIDLKVHYFSDHSIRGGMDGGFGVAVKWDVPLLDGYESVFLQRDADPDDLWSIDFPNAKSFIRDNKFGAVFIPGYRCKFERRVGKAANELRVRLVQRGEHCDLSLPGGRGRLKSVVRDLYLHRWYKRLDAICYVGETSRRHFERMRVDPEKLYRSPYAVDTDLIDRQAKEFGRPAARARLGLADDDVAVLFSGKLIDRKDPLTLVDAAALATHKSRIVLVYVGSGELQAEVEKRAAAAGVRTMMAGFVNQSGLGEYFTAADVFALPSKFETWGLVVNEAMQFGLPVIITSNMGCGLDLVAGKGTGAIIEPGDVKQLAKILDDWIERPEHRTAMSAAAKATIAGFTPSEAVKGLTQAITNQR